MIFSRGVDVGWSLPPVSRQMSLRQFEERHGLLYGEGYWPEKNIHSDPEAAAAEGLGAPVASAPTIFALVTRAMMASFGRGWVEGGSIAVKIIKPVLEEDFVTAKGTLREKRSDEGKIRYIFDVWVENQNAQKVVVGEASALVPAEIDAA